MTAKKVKGNITMKTQKKKIKATEEVKEEVKTEEKGVELTDEELSSVAGGGYVTLIDPDNIALR